MDVIEEIRAGNKEAIKQVYKENVKDVYNFAKSITGDHDSALDATKKTFVSLFTRIQEGETPTNIRLSALKIAYDEACAIAMPSTDAIRSPYDRRADEKPETPEESKEEPSVSEERSLKEEEPVPEKEISAEKENLHAEEGPCAEESILAGSEEGSSEEEIPEKGGEVSQEAEEKDSEEPEGSPYSIPAAEDPVPEVPSLEDVSEENKNEEEEEEDEKEGKKKKHSVGSTILLIVNIILVVILLWFLFGLFQNLGIIPEDINLGHQWFSETIYPLF